VTARPDALRGVFETLLVQAGQPVELDAHLGRITASLDAVFGLRPPDDLRALVSERAHGLPLARLRVTVAPGARPDIRVAEVAPEVVFPAGGPRLEPLVIPGGLGAHKWADRTRVASAEHDPGTVPLILDADGTVLEASRANVFLVSGGVLVTPAADGRLLPGVTRRRVLALARAAGIPVAERGVGHAELLAADEVFLTGSVRGVEPLRAGPVTERLAARLRELWTTKEEFACP
jgi:para-aminobenzoate synthetase / 4-amino-4-deoxychorismate lyase